MPPKRKKTEEKKKEKEVEEVPDKLVFEREIADLNAILANFRSNSRKLTLLNEELQAKNVQLREDEIDIVAFLNRTIKEQSEEIEHHQKQLKEMEEKSSKNEKQFEREMTKIQEEFRLMEDQLKAEVKMLYGKLHSLDEFRLLRDELMRKYELVEQEREEQEIRHKKEIYTEEKKFIIGKDKLKKEMEAKLRWLAQEFQNVTDIRVASTTHRVIKTNILLNKHLDRELLTQKELINRNEKLKGRDKMMRLNQELDETEYRILKHRVEKRTDQVEKISEGYKDMHNAISNLKTAEIEFQSYLKEKQDINQNIVDCSSRIKVLQQNLHKLRSQRVEMESEIVTEVKRINYLTSVLDEVTLKVNACLTKGKRFPNEFSKSKQDNFEMSEATQLINQLLSLFKGVQQWSWEREKPDILKTAPNIYMPGKLGLVPRKVVMESEVPQCRMIGVQAEGSYADILAERARQQISEDELIDEYGWEFIEETDSIEEKPSTIVESVSSAPSFISGYGEEVEEGSEEFFSDL